MTEAQMVLMVIKGTIADLSAEEQQAVRDAADKVRAIANKDNPHGLLAIALVGAELNVEAE